MIKLYSYFRSSSSYRVRIALNLKNIDYEIVPVHLVKGEQHTKEFTALNAANKIPVLDHDGLRVAQSVAIIEYLDSEFKTDPLYPTKRQDLALTRQLCEIINSDIQPLQNFAVLKKLVQDHGFSEDEKVKWIRHWIHLGFQSYEAIVSKTAGDFSMGDRPTAADCFLIPQIFNAERFELDMEPFPTIQKINRSATKHPAFVKAHPSNQPDTPAIPSK